MVDPGWARKEREAALALLQGRDEFSVPEPGSVSPEFADSRYLEVTARISASAKDLGELIDATEARQESSFSLGMALGWTLAGVVVLVLCLVLGELAAMAGSSILASFDE